jgi:two-component system phosphate regulon response regulator PhoB
MPHDRELERLNAGAADAGNFPWGVEPPGPHADEVLLRPPTSYRQAFGDEPIRVGITEFRIMLYLASWPYHAFTRRQIADAVSTVERPVAEEAVDDYIDSLRDQLGVLHDYVQTVPSVGYRFKA